MEGGVEMPVESDPPGRTRGTPVVQILLLGRLTIIRHGTALTLPGSRKVRALLGYLSLAPRPVARHHLCELLWDLPNDPRGELRWCLSKIRALIDQPDRRRVVTDADTIKLDLEDCFVDAVEIARSAQAGIKTIAPERLRSLAASISGPFLDGLDLDRSPAFDHWLTARRRRFRSHHAEILEQLVKSVPAHEVLGILEQWAELAPLERGVHEQLLEGLARGGKIREGDQHLAAATRLFEAEGLDSASMRRAWLAARARANCLPDVSAAVAPPGETAMRDRRELPMVAPRRTSICVMPFEDQSGANRDYGWIADAFAHDLTTRLAKLRSFFVIAQGTMLALRERGLGPKAAGETLDVDFAVSGLVQRRGDRLRIAVSVIETRSARVVWAETFEEVSGDVFLVLDEIGTRIVASIANEVEAVERNNAALKPPNSLDAWGAYHRALWHLYRFNQIDNESAQHFFELAIRLDPSFSRAHAGLSSTHFQNAFQGWAKRDRQVDHAIAAGRQSLLVDDHDPAAHWAMGRALWLLGHRDESLEALEQAIDLSPSFAQGHYSLAFVHAQAGDPLIAIASSDHSRHLSPFDPLLFGMLGARAMALVRLGRIEEAADWAVRAAARPNAHAQILAIAAFSLGLAGRLEEGRGYLAAIQETLPRYGVDDFLTAMRFGPEGERLFRQGAKRIGTP